MEEIFSKPWIKILYGTDGCTITYSLMMLTNQESLEELFVINYWWSRDFDDVFGYEESSDSEFNQLNLLESALFEQKPMLIFCLLGNIPGVANDSYKERTRPMFICSIKNNYEASVIAKSLLYGNPISTKLILSCIDDQHTFNIHDDLITILSITTERLTPKSGRTLESAQYDPTLSIKTCLSKCNKGRRGLTLLYIHHEQQILAAFRRIYGTNPTPFWFTSKFGPEEKTLVLATRFYLFQATNSLKPFHTYDLQAIKDFIETYKIPVQQNKTNLKCIDLISFSLLSKFCCQSGYATGKIAVKLEDYITHRINADISEVGVLRNYISADRQSLKVSDREFINYIYLAHFESFNRSQIYNHLNSVTISNINSINQIETASSLKSNTINNFFLHVRNQLNIHDYISKNVKPKISILSKNIQDKFVKTKTYSFNENNYGICECTNSFLNILEKAEKSLSLHGWPSLSTQKLNDCITPQNLSTEIHFQSIGICKKLLYIASSSELVDNNVTAIEILLAKRGIKPPLPVYRVALPYNKQAFAIISSENWKKITGNIEKTINLLDIYSMDIKPKDYNEFIERDIIFTKMVHENLKTPTYGLASNQPQTEMDINRNELFNSNLAISNIILDVDFDLKEKIPQKSLYSIMRGFRNGIITALSLLFNDLSIDWDSYPCYFYKTSCPPPKVYNYNEMDSSINQEFWDEDLIEHDLLIENMFYEECNQYNKPITIQSNEEIYCNCETKMGFRISIPVPRSYILYGSETIKGIARIIQQSVVLERTFIEIACKYLKDFSFIDTGIYSHGHSLRLPFFSKIGENGNYNGLLLPFYIIPKSCSDIKSFLLNHNYPNNFHFHSTPNHKIVNIITDIKGDYINFFDKRINYNNSIINVKKKSIMSLLQKMNISASSDEEIESFISEYVLNNVIQHIKVHFPSYFHEYEAVTVRTTSSKPDWILFQIIQKGGYSYKSQGFGCMRYKHLRGARDLARTFISISVDNTNKLCASLSQQCFATKCGNNRLCTLFTIEINYN
ncbi:helicase-primase primase subunit [Canid alphaherpesvirus 1]|nr:helicase-primase primase subunit [Canid alphaherpesvirus 1]